MKILSKYEFTTLDADLTLSDGTVVPKGTTVMFAPQTTAHSVSVPGKQSLLEAWGTLSKVGHEHTDLQLALSGYQEQLVRLTDRVTKLETKQQ